VADFVDTRSFAESHVRRVMETGTSFWSEDLTSDPSVDMTKSVSALSLRSIICVPLEGSQPVQSVLYADRAGTSAAFSRQDFELLSALVLYARLFQQNTQLHDTQRRQFAHLQYLHRLNSLVANQLDPAEIYRQVLAMCVTISQAERGYILVGPTFQGRASVDAAGKPVAPEAFDQALLDEVRQTAKPVLRVTAPSAGAQSHLGLDLRTILCVPLVVRQRFLGVVYLSANSLTVSFEPDDVNLINDLAQQAALHLEAALLHDELRRHNAEMENVLNQLTGTAAGGGSTSGSVAALGGLHFLLRRLMSEGRSGTVQVNAAGASGAVTLADGVIVQAGSSRWELVGDEALAELFSWREGEWFWVERPSQGRRDMEKKDFLFLAELRFAQRWMAINGYLSPDSKPVRLAAAQAGLSEPELHVLGLVTKGRTALELAQASHMPFREALDHLLALEAASLLAWSPIA
ncbi:MAG: GAF domain-containing protein, partial [Candidatus Sericytochromatia bacterium]|nr:GAF domain-containing protein [Candidatus Sericytochromatia bacterium]